MARVEWAVVFDNKCIEICWKQNIYRNIMSKKQNNIDKESIIQTHKRFPELLEIAMPKELLDLEKEKSRARFPWVFLKVFTS